MPLGALRTVGAAEGVPADGYVPPAPPHAVATAATVSSPAKMWRMLFIRANAFAG